MRSSNQGQTLPPLMYTPLPQPDVFHRDQSEEDLESALAEFDRLSSWKPTQPGELNECR